LRFCNELIVDFDVGTHGGTLVYKYEQIYT
jgi:hypothetical protein